MKKLWHWAATASVLLNKSHEEIISLCNYANIPSMEAHWSFVDGKTEEEIKSIRTLYEKSSVIQETFHLPYFQSDYVSSFYETIRLIATERFASYIKKASMLGSRAVILHPTNNSYSVEVEGIDRYISQLSKSFETLLPLAEKEGIVIAVENTLPGPTSIRWGSKPEHFELFVKKFSHPSFGLCLDTGHASVCKGPEGPAIFLKAMAPRLVALHLQDNAGDRDSHLAPGKGLINWKTFFQGLVSIKYSYSATIEAAPFSFGPNNTHSIDAWKEMIEDTDELLEKNL